jgi:hypothetical protein
VKDPGIIAFPRFLYRDMCHLCLKCRDQGVIAEADLASLTLCRGHLAEERINGILEAARW